MIDTIQIYTIVNIEHSLLEDLVKRGVLYVTSFRDNNTKNYTYRSKKGEIRLHYRPKTERLSVTLSIPKYIYGTNLPMVTDYDIYVCLEKLHQYIFNKFTIPNLPNIRDWEISRVDFFYNFYVGDKLEKYMYLLKDVELPKLKTSYFCEAKIVETVSWRNKSGVVLRAYNKNKECKDKGANDLVLNASSYVLRLEAVYRRAKLKSKLNYPSGVKVIVKDVMKNEVAIQLLKEYLDNLNKDLHLSDDDKLMMVLENGGYGTSEKKSVFSFKYLYKKGILIGSKKTISRDKSLFRKVEKKSRNISSNSFSELGTHQLPMFMVGDRPMVMVAYSPRYKQIEEDPNELIIREKDYSEGLVEKYSEVRDFHEGTVLKDLSSEGKTLSVTIFFNDDLISQDNERIPGYIDFLESSYAKKSKRK